MRAGETLEAVDTFIFIVMANGITYGINFPFRDSRQGDYLELTELESQEIKADLIQLLLTSCTTIGFNIDKCKKEIELSYKSIELSNEFIIINKEKEARGRYKIPYIVKLLGKRS